jgi:hypothetical protein
MTRECGPASAPAHRGEDNALMSVRAEIIDGGVALAVPVLKLQPARAPSAPPVALEAWCDLQHWHGQCRPATEGLLHERSC